MIDQFLSYLTAAGASPGTIGLRRRYLYRLETHLNKPLDQATTADLIGFIGNPVWSPETRKSVRASITGFYKWAAIFGHIPADPAALLPTVRVPRALPKPAPSEIVEEALAAASDRDRLMILLAAHEGLRRAEIARLKWADVVLDAPAVLTIHGKGGRGRMVPVTPIVRDALAVERRLRMAGRWGTGWRYDPDPASPFVFPCATHDGPMHPDTVGKILTGLLGGGWTGHTLRHRFATRAYAGTKDLRAVQELLGHSKPETTARYVAVASEDLIAAVAAAA